MAEARVERRLAAILALDIAGYSRLMGVDEEGTLAALKACRRELIDPKIAKHRGRIVKTTGDGALVEFASAVDATRCAMEIQRAMAERNAATPEDRRAEFRIGINVGDIIIDEGDIYGDGVNIAARVEALSSPVPFSHGRIDRSGMLRRAAGIANSPRTCPKLIFLTRTTTGMPRARSTDNSRMVLYSRGSVRIQTAPASCYFSR